MTILLLIRHGENDMVGERLAGRLPNVHLNARGRAQARRVAAGLATWPIRAVYASPLERAQETAEPIARVHGLPLQTHPALMEIEFGEWTGQRLRKLKKGRFWKTVQTSPSAFRFPKGESFVEVQTRVVTGLEELSHQHGEKDLVVCTGHSDVIRLAVAHFLGLPLDNFQRIRIMPASITVLSLHKGQAFFGPINFTFDFEELNPASF